MEACLAARSALTLTLPFSITAGHENSRNHNLRVQSRWQRRLDALDEPISEGRGDLTAQLCAEVATVDEDGTITVERTVPAPECVCGICGLAC